MLRKIRESKNEEGFTLIELLVVVLIIGILAAIAIPVFLNQREKAYRDAAASDVRNLALVMEDYASDNSGAYSSDLSAMGFNPSEGVTVQVSLINDDPATAGVNEAGYCILSVHSAFGGPPAGSIGAATENWVYQANSGNTVVQVEHSDTAAGTCAGTAGSAVTGA